MSATAALPPHGTPERWQSDCDCPECHSAMWTMVSESRIDGPSAWTLADMLRFRVRGCELYVVPAIVSEQRGGCVATVRRRIGRLVEFGALSKITDIEGHSGRSGIYVLHVEKLKMRSSLKRCREVLRLNEEGMTKATAWRMMMLKEHESSSGVPCVKCGSFFLEDEGCCTHCEVSRYDSCVTARCPVCQDVEIPKAFFDPKMRGELERVEKARTAFFQPRRLMLVKS